MLDEGLVPFGVLTLPGVAHTGEPGEARGEVHLMRQRLSDRLPNVLVDERSPGHTGVGNLVTEPAVVAERRYDSLLVLVVVEDDSAGLDELLGTLGRGREIGEQHPGAHFEVAARIRVVLEELDLARVRVQSVLGEDGGDQPIRAVLVHYNSSDGLEGVGGDHGRRRYTGSPLRFVQSFPGTLYIGAVVQLQLR